MFAFSNSVRPRKSILHLHFGTLSLIKCSCLGASLCFLMSLTLARQLVLRKFPQLFGKFNAMVSRNRKNLFWYMLFLRLTPLIPNWFVNLASPLVGIPYKYFLFASMFGMMPMNFILIETGQTLLEIETIGIKPHHFITLLILGVLSLIPTFIGKKYEHKLEEEGVIKKEEWYCKELNKIFPFYLIIFKKQAT